MGKIAKGRNHVSALGVIKSPPEYSHRIGKKAYYKMNLHVDRYSKTKDVLPLIIPEWLLDMNVDYMERRVRIQGQFRSHNRYEDGHRRLVLTVFVQALELLDERYRYEKPNDIFLEGYICKSPVYRRTPLGREISDVMIAVNRKHGRADYLPCICWGDNAKYAEQFKIGERVQLWGRVQSREYDKYTEQDVKERKTAYEVSVDKIKSVKPHYYKDIE